ncbi:MAG TPA: hypothetical protein VIK28_00565 [Sedimentisphaerales bacterium]
MESFLGTYTSGCNRGHKLFGHLFCGRYKSLIVDGSVSSHYQERFYDPFTAEGWVTEAQCRDSSAMLPGPQNPGAEWPFLPILVFFWFFFWTRRIKTRKDLLQ